MWWNYRRGRNKNYSKKIICETKTFYVLLAVLLISTALLIAVSIYYYLLKHMLKQKHLLPYYVTNDKLVNDKLINAL